MSKSSRVKCPACAEQIAVEALKCKHCGENFTPAMVQLRKDENQMKNMLGCGILAALAVIVLAASMNSDNKNQPEINSQKMAERADEERRGFHCLSLWDGSHNGFTAQIKSKLRDPKSFEHDTTKIAPVEDGMHFITMDFRSRNGFGGMTTGYAIGQIRNDNCEVAEATLIE